MCVPLWKEIETRISALHYFCPQVVQSCFEYFDSYQCSDVLDALIILHMIIYINLICSHLYYVFADDGNCEDGGGGGPHAGRSQAADHRAEGAATGS